MDEIARRKRFVHHDAPGAPLAPAWIMRVNGLISAQRARLAPGWSACGPRIVLVRAEPPGPRIAPTLPPQQRGDAACLTLVMAQTFGAGAARGGGYASPPEDDAPLFVRRA